MGEAVQMIVVIVVLVIAYAGIMAWTKRSGKGGGGGVAGGGVSGAGDGPLSEGLDGLAGTSSLGGAVKSRSGSGSRRDEKRFQLQGHDAEMAARVLKRMLKQDKDKGES